MTNFKYVLTQVDNEQSQDTDCSFVVNWRRDGVNYTTPKVLVGELYQDEAYLVTYTHQTIVVAYDDIVSIVF
jgi:hypothetical protein